MINNNMDVQIKRTSLYFLSPKKSAHYFCRVNDQKDKCLLQNYFHNVLKHHFMVKLTLGIEINNTKMLKSLYQEKMESESEMPFN